MKQLFTKKLINGFALSLSLSVVALFFQTILQSLAEIHEWLFFYPAIFITSSISGPRFGYLTTFICSMFALFFFIIPMHGPIFLNYSGLIEISILVFMGAGTSYLMGKVYDKYAEAHSYSKELKKSTEHLDLLIENLPLMIFVKDAKDLSFFRLNKAGEELLGIKRSEFIGKSDFDFFPKHQAEAFVVKDREVIAEKKIVEIEESILTRHLGTRILHTKKIPLFDQDGYVQYLLIVSEDITEKKHNEEEILRVAKEEIALKERESITARETFLAKVSTVLSASLDYNETLNLLADLSVTALGDWCTISIINSEGKFERATGAHVDKSKSAFVEEYLKNYPIPSSVQSVLEDKSYLSSQVKPEQIQEALIDQRQLELLMKLGTNSCMIVPIKSRGKIRGALSFLAGTSKPNFTMQDLRLAEDLGRRAGVAIENAMLYSSAQSAIRARDEFVSIASHELKTPITSLKMQIQMMIKGLETQVGSSLPPEKLFKYLTNSSKQVDRLTMLVEDLLDVTRIETGKLVYKFEDVNLSKLATEVSERFTEEIKEAKCTLVENFKENIMLYCDRYRIEQVIVNLISNAIKYGSHGPVAVTIDEEPGQVIISVKDSGMGIAKEMQSKIFERFERAISNNNISGLGLGLYISKRIIDAHHGTIEVESELGKGSVFKVLLPTKT